MVFGWLLMVVLECSSVRDDGCCHLGGGKTGEKGMAKMTHQRPAVVLRVGSQVLRLVAKWPLMSGSWGAAAVMESISSSQVFLVMFIHGEPAFLERCEGRHSLSLQPLWGLCCCAWNREICGCSLSVSLVVLCLLLSSSCMAGKGDLVQCCRFVPRPGLEARTGSSMSYIMYWWNNERENIFPGIK